MDIVDPNFIARRLHGEDRRPLLTSRAVCEYFGVVPRTLHRWVADRELGFPRPVIVKKRQYWRPRDLENFELLRTQAEPKDA
jgi:predicted DNA-binding transcriptional regulator AlpA